MTDRVDLLAHFPRRAHAAPGAGAAAGGARRRAWRKPSTIPAAPRVLVVEAPPGVGKSHVAMALARWSGDAYLLTSQKLLQDQYEREFGASCSS